MHFHLPKPHHGWRGSLEVIIVIGVLIALSADSRGTSHWRNRFEAVGG